MVERICEKWKLTDFMATILLLYLFHPFLYRNTRVYSSPIGKALMFLECYRYYWGKTENAIELILYEVLLFKCFNNSWYYLILVVEYFSHYYNKTNKV